jgi:adenine-specific DNA-methyltransferase
MLCLTIDDYEKDNASILLKRQFGNDSIKGIVAIRNNPQGKSTVKGFAINHEYALFTIKSDKLKSVGRLEHSQKQKDRYSETDKNGSKFLWENFRKTGTDSNHTDRPKQFYPIYVDIKNSAFRIPKMAWDSSINGWEIKDKLKSGEVEILPVSDTGEEKVWKCGIERIIENPEHIKIEIKGNDIQIYRRNYYNAKGSLPNTWWDKPQYAAGSHGTNLLTNLFGENRLFLFPKSVYAEMDCITVCNTMPEDIVLDYFGGSGTTGHAVINLNREDSGSRKYILVEIGEYFNTVTKPHTKSRLF